MGRHSKTVIEYRSYEFPPHFPLRVIAGEEWRISDVPRTAFPQLPGNRHL